jgi:hypothetical protein
MTDDQNRITLEEDGRLLAEATLSDVDESGRLQAQVHVEAGHLPPGTRSAMAEAIHERVQSSSAEHLTAAVPLGDGELIDGIRRPLTDVTLRAAGVTSLIDGDVAPSDPPPGD